MNPLLYKNSWYNEFKTGYLAVEKYSLVLIEGFLWKRAVYKKYYIKIILKLIISNVGLY